MKFLYITLLAAVAYLAIRIGLWIREKRKQKRLEAINTLFPEVEAAFNDIAGSFNYGHYLTESERKEINARYSEFRK